MSSVSPDESNASRYFARRVRENGLSAEAPREAAREWTAQVGTAQVDPLDSRGDHAPRDAPARRFDLGKLGHRSSIGENPFATT